MTSFTISPALNTPLLRTPTTNSKRRPLPATHPHDDKLVHRVAFLERNKTEASSTARVLVALKLALCHLSVGFEELFQLILTGLRQAAHKDLLTALLGLVFWDRTFHVHLNRG